MINPTVCTEQNEAQTQCSHTNCKARQLIDNLPNADADQTRAAHQASDMQYMSLQIWQANQLTGKPPEFDLE